MILYDKIYGHFEITEPVLIELLELQCLKRLQGVSSGGYYPGSIVGKIFNRYDHSVGVLLLLRKFNASIEEQIAGLIHDVTHAAFSHTIDYVLGTTLNQKTHRYQDSMHFKLINESPVPLIIKKYSLEICKILDDSNWKLKETTLPDVCADRIDYFLRTLPIIRPNTYEQTTHFVLENLEVSTGRFVFRDKESALCFSQIFNEADEYIWSGFSSAIMFLYSGLLLKYALKRKYINVNDLYQKSEDFIITKLKENNDNKIKEYLSILHYSPVNFTKNDLVKGKKIQCKVRRVNPYLFDRGRLCKLSDINNDFHREFSSFPKYKLIILTCKFN